MTHKLGTHQYRRIPTCKPRNLRRGVEIFYPLRNVSAPEGFALSASTYHHSITQEKAGSTVIITSYKSTHNMVYNCLRSGCSSIGEVRACARTISISTKPVSRTKHWQVSLPITSDHHPHLNFLLPSREPSLPAACGTVEIAIGPDAPVRACKLVSGSLALRSSASLSSIAGGVEDSENIVSDANPGPSRSTARRDGSAAASAFICLDPERATYAEHSNTSAGPVGVKKDNRDNGRHAPRLSPCIHNPMLDLVHLPIDIPHRDDRHHARDEHYSNLDSRRLSVAAHCGRPRTHDTNIGSQHCLNRGAESLAGDIRSNMNIPPLFPLDTPI